MRLFSGLLALLLLISPAVRAAVLAIDYGAEFTKLSLVKPGVPLDVVLDRDSKRKIQSVVTWKRNDRVFGQEGKMSATRFPETHYPYVKPLIGAAHPPSLPLYPNPPHLTADGTLIFPHPSPPSHISPHATVPEEAWTPTAILAHQISYFRDLAQSLNNPGSTPESISQVIVTVPAWWNQYQRRAYRDALELQGLTCLAMIGEGTGVALNYAMTRTFPDYNITSGEGSKEYHLIYDSGALSTTATVVAFYQTSAKLTPKSKTLINTTHVEVVATGWEETGGVMLDLKILEALAADFARKTGLNKVREDKRAMAKLAREAVRVKHILSANQESNVAIEGLLDDVDYRSRFSRGELETAIEDKLDAFASPIKSAMEKADIDLNSITSVILFGGNTRVPFVQSAIKSVLGGDERIAQNVNSDEAAVLGAAYYGAALSRQFKMKSIELHEKSVYDITVGDHTTALFSKGTKLGDRKTLVLPAVENLTLEFAQNSQPILSVQVVDLNKALANFSAPFPVINLTMRLDPRGHLSTANAVLVSNITDAKSGMADTIKGLFGGKKEKEIEATEDVGEAEGKGEKVAVRFREKHVGQKSMSGEEKRTTFSRLSSIAAYESAKSAREEARNLLEGYMYRLSGLLQPEPEIKALKDFSTESERAVLSKALAETFEWLSDNAERADEKTLRSKRSDLDLLEQPIVHRFTEAQSRPKAIEDFQTAMFSARTFSVEARKNTSEALEAATPEKPVAPPKYTEEELSMVETMLKDNEVWIDEKMKVQTKLNEDATNDPVILTKDLNERGKKLQMTVLRLISKKAPRAPKPVLSSSSTVVSASTPLEEETLRSTSATSSETIVETASALPSESRQIPTHEDL